MNYLQRGLGGAVAALALLALSWASTAPLAGASSSDAILRISLSARPERIETCRTVSDEELAKVAPQMRLRTICEGTTARYLLEVRRDSAMLLSRVVRGGGLRYDRQLYVSADIPVPAGEAAFDVQLARIDSATPAAGAEDDRDRQGERERAEGGDEGGGREAREREERQRRREEAVSPALRLQLRATLAPREVLLVSYDPDERRLVSRRPP